MDYKNMPLRNPQNSNNNDSGIIIRNEFGITDYQPQIQLAIDTLAARGGGEVKLDSGVFSVSNTIVLKTNCKLSGTGLGTTIRANNNFLSSQTSGVRPIIRIDEAPNVTYRCTIASLQIDGNRANQTGSNNVHGIYIYQKNNGVSGGLDQYHTITNIFVTQCRGSGLYVGGAGSPSGAKDFYNIRVLKVYESEFVRNDEQGVYLLICSDSLFDSCNFSTNRKEGFGVNGGANLIITNCKCFYNNIVWNPGGGDYNLVNSRRMKFLACEVQESYSNGLRISGCTEVTLVGCLFDANGSAPPEFGCPRNSSRVYQRTTGCYLINSTRINLIGCSATDFHGEATPANKNYSWQDWGLTVDNCTDINAELFSYWQFSGNYRIINVPDVTTRNIRVQVNNTIPTTMLGIAPATATSPGRLGETRVLGGYVYYCFAPDSWLRGELVNTW
jgi:Right handed beta helix region